MKLKHWLLPLSLVVLFTLAGERAAAQTFYQRPQTNPFGQPAFSPYINLLRSGSSPGVNFYGIVRPEQRYNASINALQRQTAANTANIAGEEGSNNLPFTGHPTQFLNTSHFFQSQGGGGTGRGTTGRPTYSTGSKPSGGGASGGSRKP